MDVVILVLKFFVAFLMVFYIFSAKFLVKEEGYAWGLFLALIATLIAAMIVGLFGLGVYFLLS